MEGRGIETMLSYHCLIGPLLKNHASSFDIAVNKYCVKFRTYIVEYDVEEVCQGFVLATICEPETSLEWYFRSCTQCASLVTVVPRYTLVQAACYSHGRYRLHNMQQVVECGDSILLLWRGWTSICHTAVKDGAREN
ncbi:hypothetical protein MTR_4g011200 [Medicago truncatula]|uniref:Uncharacterized protein n=1 Tax=Medicago truncatula TaxID=3880 RepID=A0A072US53_MEDTR|nr:hypothetical protein MTR_4g011200 [Medicago truncatula]